MTEPKYKFAELLTKAIYQIKRLEAKKISIIQDEIGYALGKKGRASIEHWRKGNFPVRWTELDSLTRILMQRGKMDQPWLESFLILGKHPSADTVIKELFPDQTNTKKTLESSPPAFKLPTNRLPKPGNLPAGSHMPLSRNRFFVGRRHDLLSLARHFEQGQMAAVGQAHIAAASGLGGVGKTQLASEFVHRYGQFFPGGVFWLSFEDAESVPSKIAACGGISAMNLSPIFFDLPLEEQIKLVQQAWQSPTPRLLVFDNCEDEELLADWLPTSGGCRILITTRRGEWDPILGVQTISLGKLYRHESINLLKSLSGVDDVKILDQIAAELGDLPLALHMAGMYLKRRRRSITPETYLAQLQDPRLLDHPSLTETAERISPTGHVQHVARTFALSFEQLDLQNETDQIAHALLVRAAHFAPGEPIWFHLLSKTIEPIVGEKDRELKTDQGFSRLIDLGLVEYKDEDDILRMHRLVAAFVRQFAEDEVQATLETVEEIVFEETAHINKAGVPVPLLSWNLHLRAVTENAVDRHSARGAWLLNTVGEHFRQAGDYQGAKEYFKKALDIWQDTVGEGHEDTAEGHLNYGKILRDLGELDEAEGHLKQGLDLRLKILGDEHPKTAEAYNEYGRWLLRRKENHREAQTYFEKAVKISTATVGRVKAATADYLNNLGMSHCYTEEHETAIKHVEKALIVRRQIFGENNARTALSLNNMGFILLKLRNLEQAEIYYRRALIIRQTLFGNHHPETAETLNNIGFLYIAFKEYEKARPVLSQAINICEETYKGPHPHLIQCLNGLGLVEYELGDIQKSKMVLNQALSMGLKILPKRHPLNEKIRQRMSNFGFIDN